MKVNGFFDAWGNSQAIKLIGILTILVLFVTAVYGPIAAALVEFFPTRIRYTAMSLPYHIGNGWFGGFLPPTAFAMVASTGDIYYGLWYPIVIALGDVRHRPDLRAGDEGPRHLLGRNQVRRRAPLIRRLERNGSPAVRRGALSFCARRRAELLRAPAAPASSEAPPHTPPEGLTAARGTRLRPAPD